MPAPQPLLPPPGELSLCYHVEDEYGDDGQLLGRHLLLPEVVYRRLAGPYFARSRLLPVTDSRTGALLLFDYEGGKVQGARFEEWCAGQQVTAGGKIRFVGSSGSSNYNRGGWQQLDCWLNIC
ncbi:hypothetical protein C2E21_1229 [Chlorella sorokiniana]|uniref:Uncharacterized protein n=1 Tax=Chlorella sorokiniana TaxID=3076 RepID=A0A2P6U393_CHLSO|nr:hypothetical protein C2E21_1229 [Chlorella sorokiniana]|eukprot:PRW60771.1 hypothetical protein C2E21_1229 [Chlorella sorokiniana]